MTDTHERNDRYVNAKQSKHYKIYDLCATFSTRYLDLYIN